MDSRSIRLQVPQVLRDLFETAVVFLYPASCRVCETTLEVTSLPYICADCWCDIQFVEPPWCDICGTPGVNGLCDECGTSPPRYGKLRSIAFYQTTLQQAIHLFKFQKKKVFAPHLIQLINAHVPVDCCIGDYDFVLPVPIHKKRLQERGFNQATLLAKGIAQAEGVPVLTGTLVRHRHTAAQSSLGMEARQQNIIGAFDIQNPETIRDKRLLLVDDVFTTGATVREAVNELWKADPAEVDVLTLARTLSVESP